MWQWPWHQRTKAPAATPAGVRAAASAAGAAGVPQQQPFTVRDFVAWLLGVAPGHELMRREEHDALAQIDALLRDGPGVAALLPRAPAVIPQLLGALRHRDQSLSALVERVSKDLLLVAEVMRLSRSVHYAPRRAVRDLPEAIAVLGERGLQAAIARVVLRPLLQSGSGALPAAVGERLWEHTEQKARHCSALAQAAGLDAFDGYMAGMLHNAGWTVALRKVEALAPPALPWSGEFIDALAARRDRLFGMAVGRWQVTPAISALAAEAADGGFERNASPLARALLQSDGDATRVVLRDARTPAQPLRAPADERAGSERGGQRPVQNLV